jgi:phosphoserine aminotransferase
LDYKIHVDNNSLYNTPPCFGIYIAGEVFKYLVKNGGVKAMEEINRKKADLLYKAIEDSSLYSCPVKEEDRSLMNVVFVTGNDELDKKFVSEAKAQGMINLGGHRSIGGMRASIYNAMPMEGVEVLVDFMDKFEKTNK